MGTMGKCRPRRNQTNKIYIVQKVVMRVIQKLLNSSNCVKRYGHLCQIYHDHSPNMVTSRNPASKIRKFLFSPNSILNFRKSYQIWREIGSRTKHYMQKQIEGGGVETHTPPVLIGLKSDEAHKWHKGPLEL